MRAVSVRPHLARVRSLQARLHRARRAWGQEQAALAEALDLYRRGGERLFLIGTLVRLMLLAARRGNLRLALRYGRKATAALLRSPQWLLEQHRVRGWAGQAIRGF
jgi:hypothetical protein